MKSPYVDKVDFCVITLVDVDSLKKITKNRFYASKKLNYPLIRTLWRNYRDQGIPVKNWRETVNEFLWLQQIRVMLAKRLL